MKRSKHSLSHYRLMSCDQGQLYPVMCQEVLPGDTWRQQSSVLLRVSPLVAPVMHPVDVSLHCYFVPSRICWTNWENFITGFNTALSLPVLTYDPDGDANNIACGMLAKSLGVGADTASVTVQSLPFRGYNLIYNEFYRDKDLQTAQQERTGDSGDVPGDYSIRAVSWEKDYFTTARAQPQQGSGTEVVPITFTQPQVPVKGIGKATTVFAQVNQVVRESGGVGTVSYPTSARIGEANNDRDFEVRQNATTGFPDIFADLTGITAGNMNINDWRRSMAMQKVREHRNRFGSDYASMLRFLGVTPQDSRLQRPEYLGGGRQTVSFSEVLSTADVGTADVGTMAGHGIAALRTRPFRRFIPEHGYVYCLLFVRPKTCYQQHVNRTFLRRVYSDFWQREYEMMGEQIISNFEVFGDAASPNGTFGYIPRFDEYRHAESFVDGEFRNILNYWHMGRIFTTTPTLNGTFVNADPTTRIYASAITDQLYVMCSHRIAARRLVSKRARS